MVSGSRRLCAFRLHVILAFRDDVRHAFKNPINVLSQYPVLRISDLVIVHISGLNLRFLECFVAPIVVFICGGHMVEMRHFVKGLRIGNNGLFRICAVFRILNAWRTPECKFI